MYRYYLAPVGVQDTDTIYVIDTVEQTAATDAACLVEQLGCERITRRVALKVDMYNRHTGRGSVWARGENGISGPTLADVLADAVDATREMVDCVQALGGYHDIP